MFNASYLRCCAASVQLLGFKGSRVDCQEPIEPKLAKPPLETDLHEQNLDWDFTGVYGGWRRAWNPDWDHRAPSEGAPPIKGGKVRHLLFIRHGQYELNDKAHGLTELGKKQARRTGLRLKQMMDVPQEDHYGRRVIKFTSVASSNMLRAVQTADIIKEVLGDAVPRDTPDPILAEGIPLLPTPRSPTEPVSQEDPGSLNKDGSRAEAAFRNYVHRDANYKKLERKKEKKEKVNEAFHPENTPEPTGESTELVHEYEIIVCHCNIIRYFVCRALQLPPEAWLRMRGDNCCITEIIVAPTGRVSLNRFGDSGHLDNDMITFH